MKNSLLIYVCAAGQGPEWFRILPLGRLKLVDNRDPLEVDAEALRSIVSQFRERGVDLVVDYEHQTLSGGKAPAAGWIKDMEVRADGLYARIKWTATALRHLQEQEYRYYSPVLRLNPETRRPTVLLHLGLTNNPAIANLPPLLAAKYGGEGEFVILREFSEQDRKQAAQGEDAMPDGSFPIKTREDLANAIRACGRAKDPEVVKKHIIARAKAMGMTEMLPADWPGSTKKKMEDGGKTMKKEMMRLLGLPEAEDKPDQEILALVADRLTLAGALPEIARAAGLEAGATVSQVRGAILALKQGAGELTALKSQVATLEQERREEKADAAVLEALKAGKLTPAEKNFALEDARRDLEAFKARMAVRPKIVPVGEEFRFPAGQGQTGANLPPDAPADQVLALKAQELAAKENIALDVATNRVFAENPDLVRKWQTEAAAMMPGH